MSRVSQWGKKVSRFDSKYSNDVGGFMANQQSEGVSDGILLRGNKNRKVLAKET